MYCPRCGEMRLKENTNFCSRCRFLLIGLDEVVANGGLPKEMLEKRDPNAVSPRRSGLKQGALLFLSGILIVPILGILTSMVNGEGYLVGIAAILTFLGGLLRMIYALFESGVPTLENTGLIPGLKKEFLGTKKSNKELPPQQTEPIADMFEPPVAGNWRETADLQTANVDAKMTEPFN